MSPFGSPDSKSLWDDVKLEWKGIVFLVVVFFLLPTIPAACGGKSQVMAITAMAALPGAVLSTAITVVGSRAMSGRAGPTVAKRVFRAYCLAMLLMLLVLFCLVVRYFVLMDAPAVGLVAAALSCVGMAILWRMYKSGIAKIASSGHP